MKKKINGVWIKLPDPFEWSDNWKDINKTYLLDNHDIYPSDNTLSDNTKSKNLKCSCQAKWAKGDDVTYHGHYNTKFDGKFVGVFIRKCNTCNGLRIQLSESKRQEQTKEVKQDLLL